MIQTPSRDHKPIQFIIYSREGCCLCDQMREQLADYLQNKDFHIQIIDIDSDPQLVDLYAGRIPVLSAAGQILCEYHLNSQAVDDYLTSSS